MSDRPKSKPMALCLERLASATSDRYVRCTAQVGRELGLALGMGGRILWCEKGGAACEIWVSADQRLMAYCPADTPTTTLHRAGRSLELPKGKPVVLRHEDELDLEGVRFRVHVHGIVDTVQPPTVVRTLARAAAAVALAVTLGGASGCSSDDTSRRDGSVDAAIEVLNSPPGASPEDVQHPDAAAPVDAGASPSDAIEVLETPPIIP